MTDPIQLYPDPEDDPSEMEAAMDFPDIEPGPEHESEYDPGLLERIYNLAYRAKCRIVRHARQTVRQARDWQPGKPRSRGPSKAEYQASQRAVVEREAARERQHRIIDEAVVTTGHRDAQEIEAAARERLQGRIERTERARTERREARRATDPARKTADKLRGSHPDQQRAYLEKMRRDRPSIADRVRDALGL